MLVNHYYSTSPLYKVVVASNSRRRYALDEVMAYDGEERRIMSKMPVSSHDMENSDDCLVISMEL